MKKIFVLFLSISTLATVSFAQAKQVTEKVKEVKQAVPTKKEEAKKVTTKVVNKVETAKTDAKTATTKAANKVEAAKTDVNAAKNAAGVKLKKDGTPDKRYKENKKS